MKRLILATLLAISILAMPSAALAQGTPTRIRPAITIAGQVLEFDASKSIIARISPDKHWMRLFFLGFGNVDSLSYTLTYLSNGVAQGVVGTIVPNEQNSILRNILLGTCSARSCVYHENITNMMLEVTTEKNGQQRTKSFSITI